MIIKRVIFDSLQPIRKLVGTVRTKKATKQVINFTLRQSLEDVHIPVKRGVSSIAIERIIGSVGRPHDFDNLSKHFGSLRDERLLSILSAMKMGKKMPPIALYKIKSDFYIVDGHHRFKAALELGYTTIDANIVELIAGR